MGAEAHAVGELPVPGSLLGNVIEQEVRRLVRHATSLYVATVHPSATL